MYNKILKLNKNNKLLNYGFTLVEIMVATSIFIVIMIMALGSLMSVSSESKQSRKLGIVMDNINFATESMTRSLRMGKNYICKLDDSIDLANVQIFNPASCPRGEGNGGTLIAFLPTDYNDSLNPNTIRAYKLSERSDGTHTIQRCDYMNKCSDIVSSDVDVDKLQFFVDGALKDDYLQPSIYILLKGKAYVGGEATPFVIQTMVSQRSTEVY